MNITKKDKTMTYAVAVNSSGQATIPKAIRDLLGVVPGENRLTFDIVKGKVVLGKEKSRAELLDESLQKIWTSNEKLAEINPEYAAARKRNDNLSFNEIRDAYDKSPEGKREFKEEYGFDI